MNRDAAGKSLSARSFAIGLILALAIRIFIQGLKEPLGSLAIDGINFIIRHGFADQISVTSHQVAWLLPSTYVITGVIGAVLGLWLASRVIPPKPKPLPKQGL